MQGRSVNPTHIHTHIYIHIYIHIYTHYHQVAAVVEIKA